MLLFKQASWNFVQIVFIHNQNKIPDLQYDKRYNVYLIVEKLP